MRFIKTSQRKSPKVSLILLDWSVRESFHLLHYLSKQTVARDDFEVIIVEYYDRVSDGIRAVEEHVDTWVVLDTPHDCYYHKHHMYNVGLIAANGEIIMIGDSDAMVKPTFIETIIRNFKNEPEIVYHMDQFRNVRRDLYPFNFPSFEEVLGEGSINNAGGVTAGVLDEEDPIHTRNFGACMCALRKDLIDIGGADMHIDYLGHICGPYDMTFRLVNYGRKEVWEKNEFLYHTWHPGQGGLDNHLGPHDGRHMSTTALEAISSRRVRPLLESPAIRILREGGTREAALAAYCPSHYWTDWNIELIRANDTHQQWRDYRRPLGTYKGFRLITEVDRVIALSIGDERDTAALCFEGADIETVQRKIDAAAPFALHAAMNVELGLRVAQRALSSLFWRAGALPLPLPRPLKIVLAVPFAPVALLALCAIQPRRLADKVKRAVRTRRNEHGCLVAGLYNLQHWGDAKTGEPLILLVENEMSRHVLRLFAAVGLISPVRIYAVPTAAQFHETLTRLDAEDGTGKLVMSAELHQRHHAAVSESNIGKHCIDLGI